MPHSTSPETPIAEPPSQQTMAEPSTNPVDSQTAEDADVDMDEGPQREQQPIVKNEEDKKEMKLDDLFADVDSDEEFPSTKPKAEEEDYLSDSPDIEDALGTNGLSGAKASDPEVMRMFYQRLFPWRYLFQWLNHSPTPSDDFKHREFAFTLQNDAYLRYQSFATSDLLRKDVLRLLPSRFEIGPVYTTNPRERKTMRNSSAFKPLSKELCFDIDLTDYDDIRTCCDKANICNKCWQFITMAIAVVDTALRDDFGFEHIMWVYSGRRGAHAWVCDKKARGLDDQKRRGIAGYLEILRGGAQSGKKVNLRRPLHPHVSRSLDLLKSHFQSDVLEAQNPWADPARAENLLALLPNKALSDSLRTKWESSPGRSSTSKWADIDAVAKSGQVKNLDSKQLLEAKQDIVLEYTYPRLDIEVSKKLNHLLKSPFVVHPGTGRVCVPIDLEKLDDFDPLEVPTVQGLLAEIDSWKPVDGEPAPQDWEKTSLRPYIEKFRTFVLALMKGERDPKVKREREDEGMEF